MESWKTKTDAKSTMSSRKAIGEYMATLAHGAL